VNTNKNKPTKEKERKKKANEVNIKEKRKFPPYHFWSDFPKHYLHGMREAAVRAPPSLRSNSSNNNAEDTEETLACSSSKPLRRLCSKTTDSALGV